MLDLARRLQRPTWPRGRTPGPVPRRWAVRLALAAIGSWLVYSFVFSDQGLVRIASMRRELARAEARSRVMASNVKQVDEELQRVRTDPFYTEKFLRENAGMVRPGEIVIRVVPESVAQQAIHARSLVLPPLPKGPRGLPPGAPRQP
ncbi:MAG TPA: septum formation initiator family protein [Candidatus Saccharimonadales bacterium]|nr:septum formation initiator family protein [Candidatus Saccharimonadales bacterium]